MKMQTLVQTQRMLGAGAGTQTVCRWCKVQLIVNQKQGHFRGPSPRKPGLAPPATP